MICAIADSGNVTKAAQKLFVSQSALSQQLKDIEDKLKIDLFYRTRKKMILTPMGKKVLQTAEHVIGRLEDTELEIAKVVSGDRGELKVGTQCIFCYKWLPRLMSKFQSKFPNIEFEIGTSENAFKDLQSKRYDFVIMAAADSMKESEYDYIPLFADQMVCVMPADHPLSSQSFVRFEDFAGFNLISHSQKAQNRFYSLCLKPRSLEPRRFMTVVQPHAMIEMVASRFGISVFPRWAITGLLETSGITARPITRNGLPVTWYATMLKNRQVPVYQQEFLHILRKLNPEGPPASADKIAAGF